MHSLTLTMVETGKYLDPFLLICSFEFLDGFVEEE